MKTTLPCAMKQLLTALAAHLSIAPEFIAHLRAAVAPGSTLIVTDLPVSRQTHSKSGFGILTADAGR